MEDNAYGPYDRDTMIAKMAEIGYGETWSRTNLYICEKFGEHGVWTIERIAGVTPFMIPCDACDGTNYMQSQMGRAGDAADQVCRYEWDFPTNEEFAALELDMQRHVTQGGLIRRPNLNFGKWEEKQIRRDRSA